MFLLVDVSKVKPSIIIISRGNFPMPVFTLRPTKKQRAIYGKVVPRIYSPKVKLGSVLVEPLVSTLGTLLYLPYSLALLNQYDHVKAKRLSCRSSFAIWHTPSVGLFIDFDWPRTCPQDRKSIATTLRLLRFKLDRDCHGSV